MTNKRTSSRLQLHLFSKSHLGRLRFRSKACLGIASRNPKEFGRIRAEAKRRKIFLPELKRRVQKQLGEDIRALGMLYDYCAKAAELCNFALRAGSKESAAFQALAFGTSAITSIYRKHGMKNPDDISLAVTTIRSWATSRNRMIRRHMKIGDLANPADLPRWEAELIEIENSIRQPTKQITQTHQRAPQDDELLEATRNLLAGRTVFIVGGVAKRRDRERIERDLGCNVVSRPALHSNCIDAYETEFTRNDLVVAIAAIRILSHEAHDALSELCTTYAVPLIRLQAGWGSRQIADAIMKQASERLAA